METFKKRQKEMKRLERQRDKASKRAEVKERKAAGIKDPEDEILDTPLDGPVLPPGFNDIPTHRE